MRTINPELWSKKVRGRKMDLARPLRFRSEKTSLKARIWSYSYSDAMEEFRSNCSSAAIRSLASKDIGKWERRYWKTLLVVFILGALLVVILSILKLVMVQSLNLSRASSKPSLGVLFPAVALCSYGIISHRALDSMIVQMKKMDHYRPYSKETIRDGILQYGKLQMMALLTPALPIRERQIGPILQGLTSLYGFPVYNVSEVMFELAPSCNDMLVKCSWRGKEMPCDFLFAKRVTSVGFCCIFNARYESYDSNNPPRILDRVGEDNGLSVVYREDIDDYALIRRPIYGSEVLIFDGSEYPLLEGGGVRMQRTQPNASVFFELTTRTQLASSSLGVFSKFSRGCRVREAGSLEPSYSSCLLQCRRQTVEDLCRCIPYTLQPGQHIICSLDHLLCLKRHREKFHFIFPSVTSESVLREESVNALVCPECQPDCARTTYSVVANRVPFSHLQKTFQNTFTYGIKNFENASVLRFFYQTLEQDIYTLEPNEAWFERIALLCSHWVILLGLSLVTIFELVFHCTVRWRHHYVRRLTLR